MITIRQMAPGDLDWLVDRHALDYARDEGFDASFGALVREILEGFAAGHDPACERSFIA
ncbi:hypothetical protein [Sagittula sp. S175]|uniref:hypothetical protein n=1 Tax=Sagittula sp. S175 TaxID=3415129 RepID=UPI003C7D7480